MTLGQQREQVDVKIDLMDKIDNNNVKKRETWREKQRLTYRKTGRQT